VCPSLRLALWLYWELCAVLLGGGSDARGTCQADKATKSNGVLATGLLFL
jgi:hypothetical protein